MLHIPSGYKFFHRSQFVLLFCAAPTLDANARIICASQKKKILRVKIGKANPPSLTKSQLGTREFCLICVKFIQSIFHAQVHSPVITSVLAHTKTRDQAITQHSAHRYASPPVLAKASQWSPLETLLRQTADLVMIVHDRLLISLGTMAISARWMAIVDRTPERTFPSTPWCRVCCG